MCVSLNWAVCYTQMLVLLSVIVYASHSDIKERTIAASQIKTPHELYREHVHKRILQFLLY